WSSWHSTECDTGESHDQVKRSTFLQHLRRYGCYLKREGKAHSLGAIRRRAQSKPFPDTPRFRINWLAKFAAAWAFRKSASAELKRYSYAFFSALSPARILSFVMGCSRIRTPQAL